MEMTLEDLLTEEGFRGRRLNMSASASFTSEVSSTPLYSHHDQHSSSSSSAVKETKRTKSALPWYSHSAELPTGIRTKGGRSRHNLTRKAGLNKENSEKFERISSYLHDVKHFNCPPSQVFLGNETVKVGVDYSDSYKLVYSNEMFSPHRDKEKEMDKRYINNSSTQLLGHNSSSDNYRKSIKQPEALYSQSNRSSGNSKSFGATGARTHDMFEQNVAEPALDEVALQALISILSGYIKRFLNDEAFRTSLRRNCFASLNIVELEQSILGESRAIANLEQAIETVERAAEESASAKELLKASLQLSVITGLNLDALKDGFTYGIPNSKLSASAHLYLSVIYILLNKDKIAAKHLLQVFCDSPFQARTTLLPELWDHLFRPYLSHLKVWYNQEADFLEGTPSKERKLKILVKVYNEIIDSGTYQYAVYYKAWLMGDVEAASIPSIHNISCTSVEQVQQKDFQQKDSQSYSSQGVHQDGFYNISLDVGNPRGPLLSLPTVSKRLYDAVLGRLDTPGVEVEDYNGVDHTIRSSDGSAIEDKQALTCSSVKAKNMDQDYKQDDASPVEVELIADEMWRVPSVPGEGDVSDMFHNFRLCPVNTVNNQNLTCTSNEEVHGSLENLGQESSFSRIPQDFTCPLSGLLFRDPVTLETGQTFERAATTEWFDQGNKTCPVTGIRLESQLVPRTKSTCKRLVDSWRSEHCSNMADFSSEVSGERNYKLKDETAVSRLDQLRAAFDKDEPLSDAKHLISLKGLQFLLRRFEFGNLEEKTRVAAVLTSYIEVDDGCRNYIGRNISKPCLLELIHSKQLKSRANVVLLLVELMCLSRRKCVNLLLNTFQDEGRLETMRVILVYLRSSPPEQRPLVAVLLLYLDLLVEPKNYSIYREEAVDAITTALVDSSSNEKIQEKCSKALLILGVHLSLSGSVVTEDWIFKQSGFLGLPNPGSLGNEEDDVLADENIPSDDEEDEREEWLRRLSASLIFDGKNSFLESLAKCLGSGNLDLVKACLTTVEWLSSALASLSDAEFQLSAFSALIYRLKQCLESGGRVEHKILASMSLFNFSKSPVCRVLLMTIAKDIAAPLRSLAEVTWTAKELYASIIFGEDLRTNREINAALSTHYRRSNVGVAISGVIGT